MSQTLFEQDKEECILNRQHTCLTSRICSDARLEYVSALNKHVLTVLDIKPQDM